MNNKRVLLISPFFFPEPISTGKLNTDFVNIIKEKSKSVTVLCSYPFYPNWKVKRESHEVDGIKIIRGGKFIFYPKNIILRRIVLEIWFTFFIVRKFFFLRKKIDTVIPIFPPSLFFYFIKFLIRKETKVIGIIHDLQEVYTNQKRGVIHSFIKIVISQVEGSNFRNCNKLVFLSEEMKKTAQKYYNLDKKKLIVSYPFITINDVCNTNDLKDILPNNTKHVVYSGALGEKQNPKKLYSFFNFSSKRLNNAVFHFFSEGAVFNKLKDQNDNDKIKFHSLVKKENIEELYKRSTVQIIPQLEGTSKGSLPSKLPNILFSGCNALVITDNNSEIDMLFKKYNLETVVTTWNSEVLFSNLTKIIKKEKENKSQIRLAKKLFNTRVITKEILN